MPKQSQDRSVSMSTRQANKGSVKGTTIASIQIPETLHEAMKALRLIRRQQEGSDVKLSRIYREAVEQYVNAKPQQRLLKESDENAPSRNARRASGNGTPARV
jgi:hypothetical protein